MKKLVIAIQFYDKDREAAMRLAKFIVDLEPKFRDDVELCFVSRFDAVPITPGEMMRFVRTVPISWYHTETRETGHPAGCNAMAREFFVEAIKRANNGEWANVDAILMLEPDCVPVARDWIDQLRAEWDNARYQPVVVGCYRDEGVDVPHINGNALFSTRLADYVDLSDVPGLGWDSAMFKLLFDGHGSWTWAPTPLISNLFKETAVPHGRMAVNPFYKGILRPPVLIHGVKDESAWNYARKVLEL